MNKYNSKLTHIVLATRNPGKIHEITAQLQNHNISVLSLKDFPRCPEVQETGVTFAENALCKAKAVAQYTGFIALADDSGLEVDALHGAPGVYSSRYADDLPNIPGMSQDEKNIHKLLQVLIHVPFQKRTAQFQTAIIAYHPNGNNILTTGIVKGIITLAPQGTYGFGYDSIFLLQRQNKTFAELTTKEKEHFSHRGKALKKFLKKWDTWKDNIT